MDARTLTHPQPVSREHCETLQVLLTKIEQALCLDAEPHAHQQLQALHRATIVAIEIAVADGAAESRFP